MEGRLESVRGAVHAARDEIDAWQKKIQEGYLALYGEENEEWKEDKNLTVERREEFRCKAMEMEEDVRVRTRAVISLTVDCQNLMRELDMGEEKVGCWEDDDKIMRGLVMAEEESGDEKHRSSNNYNMVSLLETPECMGISNSALERLTNRLAELNAEKNRRRDVLREMGRAIHSLWGMLNIPLEEQRAFTNSIRGMSMETIHIGERELDRLRELKVVMIGKLIRDQRKKIEVLWEQTNASAAEKASFDAYFHIYEDEKLTEDLLSRHEEYVGILNDRLEKMKPILDLIAKREAIVSERFELEELKKDPERLKGRHACQQLAKEEKMDRRVRNELPRITNHLEKTLHKWYQDNQPTEEQGDPTLGHFLYHGKPYLETMHTQEHDWKMRKELEEQERHRKRDEERKSKQNSFGSSFSKLPGQKWKPSIGSTATSSTAGSRNADSRPRSGSNARSASNPRGGRPLADVSSSRGNVPRPPSRSRREDKPPVARNDMGYRATSAPRQRF
jgi:protein regulator of cytokinesis 1